MKTSNTTCARCFKAIYVKPCLLKNGARRFCSRQCFYAFHEHKLGMSQCQYCGRDFKREGRDNRFCSRSCSNSARKGIKYCANVNGNASRARLNKLYDKFGFQTCMVEGCDYNKTYDVHRLVGGKDGGKYEIGNMFAICPNHHAEATRGLVALEKIDDCTLRIGE